MPSGYFSKDSSPLRLIKMLQKQISNPDTQEHFESQTLPEDIASGNRRGDYLQKKAHLPLRASLEHSLSPLFQVHQLTISSPWWSGTWGQSLHARTQRDPQKVASLPIPASWNSFNWKREGRGMAEPKKLTAPGGFYKRIQMPSTSDRNCSPMYPLKGRYFNHRAGVPWCHRAVPHKKEQDSIE